MSADEPLILWVEAAVRSLKPLAENMGVTSLQTSDEIRSTGDLPGNYISVYGERHAYRIGVLGEVADLKRLVCLMVGAEPSDPLEEDDIWDGVGEIANILVGTMKTALIEVFPNLSIGLPMMTTGAIVYPKPEQWAVVHARLDDVPISILIQSHPLPAAVKRQRELEAEVREQEVVLENSRRLDAVGQLAAGIAHEINTPIQYIGDNAQFLKDSFGDLLSLIHKFEELKNAATHNEPASQLIDEIRAMESTLDVEFLFEEIPRAVAQSIEGVGKVAEIVAAMKAFSHPGKEKGPTDLNKTVRNTVTVSRNEWKYAAEVSLVLDEGLPMVNCVQGEINQVLMNLIVNAAHAVAEKVGDTGEKGNIVVRTGQGESWVDITVSDTGSGIPEAHRNKIFEPFFTTKEVGKGTGQGLAIARTIVVKKHGGELFFDSQVGEGTTFTVRLPLSAGFP